MDKDIVLKYNLWKFILNSFLVYLMKLMGKNYRIMLLLCRDEIPRFLLTTFKDFQPNFVIKYIFLPNYR